VDALKSILVIVDPTVADSAALSKAHQLAKRFRARVELLLCDPSLPAVSVIENSEVHALHALMHKKHTDRLASLATPFVEDGLSTTCQVVSGSPLVRLILERVTAIHPDLVVKDTHHHSLLRRTLLTNTDWHLLRHCGSPLLLVKPRLWPEVLKVAAAVDPGHPADQPAALDHAIIEAAQRISRAWATLPAVVHCWSPVYLYAMGGMGGAMDGVQVAIPQELVEAERLLDSNRLHHLARVHDVPTRDVHLHAGTVIDVLPTYADTNRVDVLVMGAIARTFIDRVFIGDTAAYLLETLPCDVLIVHQPPKAVTV
jgi:universal stress protein E